MFVYAPTPDRAAERSRYISSALVVLQGQDLVRLVRKRRGLSDETVRRKLERQGSLYAQADSFRVYAFAPGVWEEFLQVTAGDATKAGECEPGGSPRRPAQAGAIKVASEMLETLRRPWVKVPCPSAR
jgi:hypothetical protein